MASDAPKFSGVSPIIMISSVLSSISFFKIHLLQWMERLCPPLPPPSGADVCGGGFIDGRSSEYIVSVSHGL